MEPRDVTYFETSDAFRAWLEKHQDAADELWVGYWKKSTGRASVTWEETVDEALCFGWIDGIRKRVDEESYTIRFTPRRARSVWSRRNIDRIEALSKAGRVATPGAEAYARHAADRSGVYAFEQATPPQLSSEYIARLRANAASRECVESPQHRTNRGVVEGRTGGNPRGRGLRQTRRGQVGGLCFRAGDPTAVVV